MKPCYELQVKTSKGWRSIARNPDKSYLEIVGKRHFSRFPKQRITKEN